MVVTWNAAAVLDRFQRGADAGAQAAAEAVMKTANNHINNGPHTGALYTVRFFTSGQGSGRSVIPYGERDPHRAGAPGDYPARDTGDLVSQSEVIVYSRQARAVAIWHSPEAAYMQWGTDRVAPRPFASLSLAENADKIPGYFATEIRKVFR